MAFGSVSNAAPATVLPDGLCRSFVVSRAFVAVVNYYRAGEHQVGLLSSTPRSEWVLARPLAAADLATLRTFMDDRGAESFYFYDLLTDPTAVYDATGVLTFGRHTVRFVGGWDQTSGIARSIASIRLREVN